MKADAEVKAMILQLLSDAWCPQTRDLLAVKVRLLAEAARPKSIGWVRRQVRQAISELIREGHPIASDGVHGFRITSDPELINKAARQLEKTAISCLVRASKLRKIPLHHCYSQAALEFGEAS